MKTEDAVILGLLGAGAIGVIYVLQNRNKAEELQKVLDEQAALLVSTKAKVHAIGIEMQNADYPMSQEVANGIIRDLASIEGDLTKAQKLNQKAQDLGSQEDFMDKFTDEIVGALHDVAIFLAKPLVVVAVAAGIAKGAWYFGPKLMKAIIEWIKNDRGGPPPPWTCNGCGAQFGTEAELIDHIKIDHPPTSDSNAIMQAQVQFDMLSYTTALAVGGEAGIYGRTAWDWRTLPWMDLQSLSYGSMTLENLGAATAVEVVLLRSISTLLLVL